MKYKGNQFALIDKKALALAPQGLLYLIRRWGAGEAGSVLRRAPLDGGARLRAPVERRVS